jgi:hypothetical protein
MRCDWRTGPPYQGTWFPLRSNQLSGVRFATGALGPCPNVAELRRSRPWKLTSDSAAPLPSVIWLFAGYSFFSGLGQQSTNVYLPLFAHREVGFDLATAGLTTAVAGAIGVAARIFWALLVLLWLGALRASLILVTADQTASAALLWTGKALHATTILGVNVVIISGPMRGTPESRVGAASGLISLGMYAGFASGPLAMGTLLQWSGTFSTGWVMVAINDSSCT